MSDELAVIEQQARTLPAVTAHEAMVARAEVSVDDVIAQRDKVEQVMKAVMKEGIHFGKVPGVNKPTLLKPGAEVLNVTFRLAPSYHSEREYDGAHLTVTSRCVLTHINSGYVIAEGEGLCTTRESKYAYRQAGRVCPNCGMEAIIKGKQEYGGGWVCFKKKGGCGAKFDDDEAAITSQVVGKVENPDLADSWNTVLKMANKRALVAAILNGTAASDIFTQDVEDQGAAAADTHEREPEPDDGRPSWNKPASWKEISERLNVRLSGDEAKWWVEQALLALYGVKQVADLTAADRVAAAERFCTVIQHLDQADVVPLMLGFRIVVQASFAAGFDGIQLDGPPWRLGPDETDRPTRADYEAVLEAWPSGADDETPLPVAEQPDQPEGEIDDIPFGS